MESYRIYFMTKNDGFGINLQPVNEKNFNVYLEMLTCFGDIEDNVINISSEQQATDELKSRVVGFVEKYADNHPILNRLKRKIVNLSSSEYFLVLESDVVETSERLKLEIYISTLNDIENITDLQSKFEEKMNALDNFSGDLLSKYNLRIPRNDRKITIGNSKKENRCCRFCNKTMRDGVTFKKVAHAIPEGLGNKNIILGDECDNCNEFFGNNIEPTLIEHLNIYRVFLGIKGKNGVPKIKYKNGYMQYENNMSIFVSQGFKKVSDKEFVINLESTKGFTPVKLYKALCKITLSTIDEKHMIDLKQTVNWLTCVDTEQLRLPRVAINFINNGFSKLPQIVNYIRKIDDFGIPHIVSEFRIGSFVYVYIIPFSEKNTVDFIADEEYEKFWDTFKHYRSINDWRFDCLDSIKEIPINENIRLVQNGQP